MLPLTVILMEMLKTDPFRFQTRIRFIDTDASGRIHYTSMFRYFESAEIEFMRSCGITYDVSEYSFPRVHVECDFMVELKHDDLIEIEVCLTRLGRSSIEMEFRTMRAADLAAKGRIVIVCMDHRTHLAMPIPDELRAKLASAMSGPGATVHGGG
jgi:acyl-CoA thioester hydrolase